MTAIQQLATPAPGRPATILGAVVLSLIHAAFGITFISLAPDIDDRGRFVIINGVIALLLLAATWFIWTGSRRGTIAALVLNGFLLLIAIPELFATDPEGIRILGSVIIFLAVATIGLTLAPASRAYREGRRAR